MTSHRFFPPSNRTIRTPLNKASERSLRSDVATALSLFLPSSVGGIGCFWRKLSFGTHSVTGSRFVEMLLSVIETCRLQNRDVFAFVTEAVQDYFDGNRAPKTPIRAVNGYAVSSKACHKS